MNRISLRIAVVAMVLLPVTGRATAAWTETVLFRFSGEAPSGNLVSDKAGNLYGTTNHSVFKLTPPRAGQTSWAEALVYSFPGPPGNGPPYSLVMDAADNLYGVTAYEDATPGTVFKLTPPAAGRTTWTKAVIHTFGNSEHYGPAGGLTIDAAGNLYGVAIADFEGDSHVFKLTRPPAGKTDWAETILANAAPLSFASVSSVVFDKAGNLYGADAGNNACPGSGCGAVFKLTPPASGNGAWKKTVIYGFTGGTDGAQPLAGLAIGAAGVIYGATEAGGGKGSCSGYCGTVFKLIPPGAGRSRWTETVLYRFNPISRDGPTPTGGLTFDRAGNLLGVTEAANNSNGRGTVYRLTRPSGGNGAWTNTILAQFYRMHPTSEPFSGPNGAVFGTATPGNGSGGIVYKLTP